MRFKKVSLWDVLSMLQITKTYDLDKQKYIIYNSKFNTCEANKKK